MKKLLSLVFVCVISVSFLSVTASAVTMYSADGRTINVNSWEVNAYQAVGWYTSPVNTAYVNLYSMDGRTITVPEYQAADYVAVGWHYPVTMYSLDGGQIEVPPYQVEAYSAVGWYTIEALYYNMVYDSYVQYISNQQYYEAVLFLDDAIDTLAGTGYEYSVGALKGEALAAWYKSINCYLAIGDYYTYEEYGISQVSIAFTNLSQYKITAFELEFDCYNPFGEYESTYYDSYYCSDPDLSYGETGVYTWNLYGADNVRYIRNMRVTKIAFEDGSVWKR